MHARGVGPLPIPVDQFSLRKLVEAINFMMEPKVTSTLQHNSNMFLMLLLFLLVRCIKTTRIWIRCIYVVNRIANI